MNHTVHNEALHKAIDKWESDVSLEVMLDLNALKSHILESYGIQMRSYGDYIIVDEDKYFLFLLRWA